MLPELNDCVLDHVAIAVENIELSIKIYEDIGLVFDSKREIVKEQSVKTAFAPIDKNAHLELLEATTEESAIAKFISKNGAGIHHLCFRVKDILTKQKELEEKGYRMIYATPKKGANNCLVNFIHPKSSGGVLIEISESRGENL